MSRVLTLVPGIPDHAARCAAGPAGSNFPLPPAALTSARGTTTLPEAAVLRLMAAASAYLEELADRHYAATTLAVRRVHLRLFCTWAAAQGVDSPAALTPAVLAAYRHALREQRTAAAARLSLATQITRLTHVRGWCAWLARHKLLPADPAAGLEIPRLGFCLPPVCSVPEAERVLQQPDLTRPRGLRDRAILETFYSTGLRRTELLRLALADLDSGRGLVTVRQGKGRRDRIVPIGRRALWWVERYLAEVRLQSVRGPDPGLVFLTARGTAFSPNHLSALVHRYVLAAQLGKRGACHLFRHTMATLMLEGGADIRFIQQMLGHAALTSTQRYTHVSIRQLQAVHAATHPADRRQALRRRVNRPRWRSQIARSSLGRHPAR